MQSRGPGALASYIGLMHPGSGHSWDDWTHMCDTQQAVLTEAMVIRVRP